MKEAIFNAYLKKIQINNKKDNRDSYQNITIQLEDVFISDHDFAILKNISSDRVRVKIRQDSSQLSLEDINEEREKNRREKYKIL